MGILNYVKEIFLRIRGEVSTRKLVKNGMKIGNNFRRMNACWIDPGHCWLISFGDNVTLAPGVTILAHDASLQHELNCTRIGRVDVGSNVFIGARAIILPGVKIGDKVIIGAGSVVTKDVSSNSVVCGSPARKIDSYSEYIAQNENIMSFAPCFGLEYTHPNIDINRKTEMQNDLKNNRFGYIC